MSRPKRFDWLFRPQMADADLPLSAEARFAEALAELPAVERSALALSEIGDLDTNEIAERLGTDPVVVGKLLVRARESVRTSLAVRGRSGLSALFPFQNWWQTGSSAPVVRAAGVVAAAVVGSSVAIGGAAADSPRATLTSPDPPQARALERPSSRALVGTGARVRASVATAAAGGVAAARQDAVAGAGARRSVRPGVGLQRDRDAAFATPGRQPGVLEQPSVSEQTAPPVERERPAPPVPAAEATKVATTVASTVPLPPLPQPPLPQPAPDQPPVVPLPLSVPPVPVVSPPAPELPKPPPPPPLP